MNWTKKRNYLMNAQTEDEQTPMSIPLYISAPDQPSGAAAMRSIENKIFFYDDITNYTILDLNRILIETDIKLQNTKNVLGDEFEPIIHLHIKTDGGEIYAAISTIDLISKLKSKVYTYVDGCVASAGTLITMVGDKRFMGKHSNLLIHQLSSGMYGKYSEMEDTMENCTNMMKFIKSFYKENSKIPMKRIDELLKRDLWLTADECLQYGIVDAII